MKHLKTLLLLSILLMMCAQAILAQTNNESEFQVKNNIPTVNVTSGYSTEKPTAIDKLFDDNLNNLFNITAYSTKEFDLSSGSYSADGSYSSSITIKRVFVKHGGTIKVKVTNLDTDRNHETTVELLEGGKVVQSSDISIGKKKLGVWNYKKVTFDNLNLDSKYTIRLKNGTGNKYNQNVKVYN